MGEQFNIKDAEAVRLARGLAEARGTTVTAVIRAALEREAREQDAMVQEKVRRIKAAAAEVRKHLPEDWKGKTSKEIMDEIYEDGLPK
ncbi:type II toxin-antitoxin system VapB family antitoxin [Sphingomonas panacis]|uniref:type II toxin-antitoxin system VapB family antitoxin n=1 Tax=Sphingomonas panacis TaxID=1560345 RepID=UPI00147165BB|nr:type II toxin-antitoxin system VapB family antitoxin [Sphingomonas panacis]